MKSICSLIFRAVHNAHVAKFHLICYGNCPGHTFHQYTPPPAQSTHILTDRERTQVLKMNRHKSPTKKSTLRPVKLPQLNNPHQIVSISLLCLRSSNERLTMHTRRDAGGGCVARAGHRQDLITAYSRAWRVIIIIS